MAAYNEVLVAVVVGEDRRGGMMMIKDKISVHRNYSRVWVVVVMMMAAVV